MGALDGVLLLFFCRPTFSNNFARSIDCSSGGRLLCAALLPLLQAAASLVVVVVLCGFADPLLLFLGLSGQESESWRAVCCCGR